MVDSGIKSSPARTSLPKPPETPDTVDFALVREFDQFRRRRINEYAEFNQCGELRRCKFGIHSIVVGCCELKSAKIG